MSYQNAQSACRASSSGSDYTINLNFLAVADGIHQYPIYRKKRLDSQEHRVGEEITAFMLPSRLGESENWTPYWISLTKKGNFDEFVVKDATNPYLTVRLLFEALKRSTMNCLKPHQYTISEKGMIRDIQFVQKSHDEGDEVLVVQPYCLRSTNQFGYLVDFRFRKRHDVPFSRRIQQLSLSLDKNYRRNVDHYIDRYSKIRHFASNLRCVFDGLKIPASDTTIRVPIRLETEIPSDRLRTKVYLVSGNRESKSQFQGLLQYGPLEPIERRVVLLFMFREQDRDVARRLAMILRGTRAIGRYNFPGFNSLFRSDLEIDRNPHILRAFDRSSIERALDRVRSDMRPEKVIVPIVVLPEEDDEGYLTQKALFSHAEMATQVCTVRLLEDDGALRWAIANIALQVFCKAGGFPWKVRPSPGKSLIVGISQSHNLHYDGTSLQPTIEKYVAFSVMTDNSGVFQSIQVLSEDRNEDGYISKLRNGLAGVLRSGSERYSRVVVHTSFKLKKREIETIEHAVNDVSEIGTSSCGFAVVKVNHRTRFFGVNRHVNCMVPYEATRTCLGPGEYLVWFEGIYPDQPTATNVFSGPTHLQIVRPPNGGRIPDEILLQDMVNLSGANWRGFNAKSSPVSVYYCHLVARFIQRFHEHGLPLPAVEDIRPWFL